VPRSSTIGVIACALLVGAGRGVPARSAENPERAPVPPGFERLVEETRETWNVPGLSVAVVAGSEVVYARGFGLRERGRPEPVTGDTIFGLASITKLLVTGAVAVLIDEGKLELDGRVIDYLPEFEVADPHVTQRVTLRDLLTHRSGIDFNGGSGGLGEQIAEWDSSELVRRAKHLGQEFDLRSAWSYNDFGFFVLAEVISRVSGRPWNEFIRRRVAEPLGMRQTWARAWDFLPRSHVLPTGNGWSASIPRGLATLPSHIDVAVPHIMWPKLQPQLAYDPRELERTTVHFHRSPTDPCQGAWSSARDLAVYAAMWLNAGRHEGQPFVRREVVEQIFEWGATPDPSWPVRRDPQLQSRTDFVAWEALIGQASGFGVFDDGGRIQIGHSGYELGYSGVLRMDRERGLAVAVLVNNSLYADGGIAAVLLAQSVLDWHYGLPPIDRNPIYFARFREESAEAIREYHTAAARQDAHRDAKLKPTLPLAAYAGTYAHPYVGKLEVLSQGGRLVARTSDTTTWQLDPWRGDVFVADWRGSMVSRNFFTFRVGVEGRVESVHLYDGGLEYARAP
jgi:CubicO group peptidase (beta-lactamase class C family)